jgi:hypothetical protein
MRNSHSATRDVGSHPSPQTSPGNTWRNLNPMGFYPRSIESTLRDLIAVQPA